jgi:DNA ligase-1
MPSTEFRPMLASPADFSLLKYPLFASPKLDGIRATVLNSRLVSRKLLDIPNRHIFRTLSDPEFNGLDGELIVGSPTAHDVMRKTTSGVMGHGGEPEFTYFVFDIHDRPEAFSNRLAYLRDKVDEYNATVRRLTDRVVGNARANIVAHEHVHINDEEALLKYESEQVALGYEGLILRSGLGLYKHGRSTAREQFMLKVKRFEDSEAEVIGVVEEMFNGNEATTDNLGRTKRSSAKAGKVGKGTMGALQVRDLKTGVEFEIGTGFTAGERAEWWARRDRFMGYLVKYKFFPVGVKDKPRHPTYLGIRDAGDMS